MRRIIGNQFKIRNMTNNVFYLHTKPKVNIGGICWGYRVSIACRKNEEGAIEYGYSICSKADQFSRKTGRHIAELRMMSGAFKTTPFNHFDKPEEALAHFATNLAGKIQKNWEKYKRKIDSTYTKKPIGVAVGLEAKVQL